MGAGEELLRGAKELGIEIGAKQAERFGTYLDMLLKWNGKMNLTSITRPAEIVGKHFLDSISVLKFGGIPQNASLCDVGTGAGFPGVPVKIMREDIELTLMDSQQKRLDFLKALLESLGLSAKLLHMRAEDAGRKPGLREGFDIVTARAVAPLPILAEYCLPLVRREGYFLAMKGSKAGEEIKSAKKAIEILGGEEEEPLSFSVPGVGERVIIPVRKAENTPEIYPRREAAIKNRPL